MASELLQTRLRIPPLPQTAVGRTDLRTSLEHAVPHNKLVLLSAPAGYGKSTLLTEWAHSTDHQAAWLSLSEDDDEPERFLRYLLKAWERIDPSVGQSPLSWLLGSKAPDFEDVLASFVNLANEQSGHLVFVIDDFHVIRDEAIHAAITFLLDNIPPTVHFVLSGRADPPLPIARYRARGELFELRTGDLRFRFDESAAFLSDVMDLDLSNDQVASLNDRLEGWAAGLQLAALSHRRHSDQAGTLAITGRHRYVADYLAEDVLDRLPEDLRDFLLRTSVLTQLTGDLCEQLTGRTDGQAMLERLERENLFILPLDDRREWFRYHRVFGDVLYEILKLRYADEVHELHRRAARWYLEHKLPEPAFEHAIVAEDAELVVTICDLYTNAKLLGGELRVVHHWLELLPDEWYERYPILGLVQVGYMVYSGDVEGCLQRIDEVEEALSRMDEKDAHWQMARVLTVRCFIACQMNNMEAAENFADQAVSGFDEGESGFLPGIYNALGDTYRRNGRWEEARESYLRALEFSRSPAVRIQWAHIKGALADLSLRQGRLREAEQSWKSALSAVQDGDSWGVLPLPVIGWIHIRLGEILYEWNELGKAARYAKSGLERVELGGDVRAMIAGYVLTGRLALANGDLDSAENHRDRALPLVEGSAFHEWRSRFERFQLELWLAQAQLRAAVAWSDSMLGDDDILEQQDPDITRLSMARVLIIKGNPESVDQAAALLSSLIDSAEATGRAEVRLEALALQSIASWSQGAPLSAMTSLEGAFRLAEPEGYVRLFVNLGLPMARLLQEARSRGVMPDYVRTLLQASGADGVVSTAEGHHLPEPLTAREQEILHLLAVGLTNSEISERLFISPETVKKHTRNVYGKLGVRSRTEAAARARALDLLT